MDIVKNNPGCCLGDVCRHFDVSRIAVMKQLRVLENAALIVSRREGRRRLLYHNAVPIQMIHDRWTSEYSAVWAAGMTQLKYKIETEKGRSKSSGKKTTSGNKEGQSDG